MPQKDDVGNRQHVLDFGYISVGLVGQIPNFSSRKGS